MATCTDRIGPILTDLLDCLTVALVECGAPACSYFLSAAPTPAADSCCDCGNGEGQAWVALQSIAPQNADLNVAPCGFEHLATVQVGVLRCAVTLDDRGNPPTPEQLSAEALAIWRDAALIREAILCCFGDVHDDRGDYQLGQWVPFPPQGGCIGGAHTVTIRFGDCRCQDG